MTLDAGAAIGFASIAVALIGCVYALAAAAWMPRWRSSAPSIHSDSPGVTMLKPLRGAESSLADNLRSFVAQQYRGPVQYLFGVEDESDAAAGVVRALRDEFPAADIELVASGPSRGANPKVSTLLALEPRIRHPIVVLADSDIRVAPDYLERVVPALRAPGVGLVTCLYRGDARSGVWGTLAAMAIDYHFVPGVVVGQRLGLARPCFGSTIALGRDTLARIGGFAAFADHLADDHAIGEAVRARGLAVEVPPFVVAHICSERSARELVAHELRWARTVRALRPAAYAGSVIAHPVPFAVVACAMLASRGALATLAVALACRLVLEVRVDHTLGLRATRWWLGPLRDMLSFVVFVASFFVSTVTWRGRRYRVRADATLAAIGDPTR